MNNNTFIYNKLLYHELGSRVSGPTLSQSFYFSLRYLSEFFLYLSPCNERKFKMFNNEPETNKVQTYSKLETA